MCSHCFQNKTKCNNKKNLLKEHRECNFIGKPKSSVQDGRLPERYPQLTAGALGRCQMKPESL